MEINAGPQRTILFPTKKQPVPTGEEERQMTHVDRESVPLHVSRSGRERLESRPLGWEAPGRRSMVQSQGSEASGTRRDRRGNAARQDRGVGGLQRLLRTAKKALKVSEMSLRACSRCPRQTTWLAQVWRINSPIDGLEGLWLLSECGRMVSSFPSLPPPPCLHSHQVWTGTLIDGRRCILFKILVWSHLRALPFQFRSSPVVAVAWRGQSWCRRWSLCGVCECGGALFGVADHRGARIIVAHGSSWCTSPLVKQQCGRLLLPWGRVASLETVCVWS